MKETFSELTFGVLVPDRFSGTVASVHDAAVNIALHDSHGAFLVSLLRRRRDRTELSIAVPQAVWPAVITSARRGIPNGPVYTSSDGRLVIVDPSSSFSIARERRPPPPLPTASPSKTVLSATRDRMLTDYGGIGFIALLADPASREGRRRSDGNPFVRRAATILHDRSTTEARAIARLVGLGVGFTPSGDDFVGGVLTAERLLGVRLVDHDGVERALPTTTAGGASLLRVALAGYPPAYHMRILDELVSAHPEGAIRVARSHGHSSGLDALAGILWGLRSP